MSCCCVCISTAEVGIVERCGKFERLGNPGCNCLNPCLCESVAEQISTRVELVPMKCETKTADDVFVDIGVQVNTRVKDAEQAYYQLTDPERQIRA